MLATLCGLSIAHVSSWDTSLLETRSRCDSRTRLVSVDVMHPLHARQSESVIFSGGGDEMVYSSSFFTSGITMHFCPGTSASVL